MTPELILAAVVSVALFGAVVRALAGGARRAGLEPPVPLLRPGPRRRSRFAGQVLGGRR